VAFPAGGFNRPAADDRPILSAERLGPQSSSRTGPAPANQFGTEAGSSTRGPPEDDTLDSPGQSGRMTIKTTLYEKLSFNFIRDIAPVAGIIACPRISWRCLRRWPQAPWAAIHRLRTKANPQDQLGRSSGTPATSSMCPAKCHDELNGRKHGPRDLIAVGADMMTDLSAGR